MRYSEHGGDIYTPLASGREVLDFSCNINPLGPPAAVISAFRESEKSIARYPDPNCRELVRAISRYEGVGEEQVLCGNGAADLIFRIALCLKPKRSLVLAPSFSEYAYALAQAGSQIAYYSLKPEHGFMLRDDIIEAIKGMDSVWLCNPNNPTGKMADIKIMTNILEQCRRQNTMLIVDECFMDFTGWRGLGNKINAYPNLIILKALTKFFALAGLRLGYLITGNDQVLKDISCTGQPWSVSVPAQFCGTAALSDPGYIRETLQYVEKQRALLYRALSNLELRVYESQTNFLLFESRRDDLDRLLLNENILIRSCGNFRGLDNRYYRIAVRTQEENLRLIQALHKILSPEKMM